MNNIDSIKRIIKYLSGNEDIDLISTQIELKNALSFICNEFEEIRKLIENKDTGGFSRTEWSEKNK
ncbi:MAG: hypothetical protein AABY32_01635 [Nanoarchaeota archaeon]